VALAPLSFSVDEFVGTVSQGSPEGLRSSRWADGFESRLLAIYRVGIHGRRAGLREFLEGKVRNLGDDVVQK